MTTESSLREQSGAPGVEKVGWLGYLAMCAVGLTLLLTWLGPRAADGLGTLNSIAFWAAHVFTALALLAVIQKSLARFHYVASLSGLAQVILTAIVASLLFIPVALAIDVIFDVQLSSDDAGEPFLISAVSEFAQFVVPIVLCWSLINAPSLLRIEVGSRLEAPPEAGSPVLAELTTDEAEFWSRVPKRLGRGLVALSAELHYLRVYTTQGEALILFPFGRAVEALRNANGIQVHRSHWVALDRVEAVVTRDGRAFCKMVGGLSLPVSRSFRAGLKVAMQSSAGLADPT
jgi:hypothetical protein